MSFDAPYWLEKLSEVSGLIGETEVCRDAYAAGLAAGREAAEHECIKVVCFDCANDQMPEWLKGWREWWHGHWETPDHHERGRHCCDASDIYEHIRRRNEEPTG